MDVLVNIGGKLQNVNAGLQKKIGGVVIIKEGFQKMLRGDKLVPHQKCGRKRDVQLSFKLFVHVHRIRLPPARIAKGIPRSVPC